MFPRLGKIEGVNEVASAGVAHERLVLVDVGVDDFRLLEFFPIGDVVLNLEPLVGTGFTSIPFLSFWPSGGFGFELFTEGF